MKLKKEQLVEILLQLNNTVESLLQAGNNQDIIPPPPEFRDDLKLKTKKKELSEND